MIHDNKQTLVYYHKNCNDGTGAAVALFSKVPSNAKFIPIQYGDKITIESNYVDIVFADFCPTKDDIDMILKQIDERSRLIILDHHATALANIKSYVDSNKPDNRLLFYFDNTMCGSLIAFHIRNLSKIELSGTIMESDDVFTNLTPESIVREDFFLGGAKHRFYELLDIRDRWVDVDEEEKKEADYLSSFLYISEWNKKPISELYEIVEDIDFDGLNDMLNYGEIAYITKIRQAETLVTKASKHVVINQDSSKEVELAVCFTSENISDAGSLWNKMGSENGDRCSLFVGIIVIPDDELIVFSARSSENVSARAFCESFGGGGHVQASGARVPELYKKSPDEIIKTIIQAVEKEKVII